MNTLFVDKRGIELKVDSNALAVYQDKTRVSTIPLAPLKRIFLQGDVQLSASVLAKLGEYQIAWSNFQNKTLDPYSAGIALYGVVHRKDDKMMDELYDKLVRSSNKTETIDGVCISTERIMDF